MTHNVHVQCPFKLCQQVFCNPGPLDTDVFVAYLKKMTPLRTDVEGRLRIYTSNRRPPFCDNNNNGVSSGSMLQHSTLAFLVGAVFARLAIAFCV